MVIQGQDGGGNILRSGAKIIRRAAAIGDCIASTIVADKLIDLGYEVSFQCHASIHSVLRRHPRIASVQSPGGICHVNLDNAYEKNPLRRQRHFYGIFMDVARMQLAGQGIDLGPAINCRPRLLRSEASAKAARAHLEEHPKPWVFICPRSESYAVRQVPDGVWQQAVSMIKGSCFWVGLFPGPKGIIDLHCRHLPLLMDYVSNGDLMISVDTGPMHVANALGVQVLAIGQSSSPELHLSDQTDFFTIEPPGLACLNCQEYICRFNQWRPPCQEMKPEAIAEAANRALKATQSETISAVIPVFKPRAQMLNRCLEAVLPQVDEVIITRERGGVLPSGLIESPKIRSVMKQADGIGFGRNVNFGARHTSGKYLLILNDDVYLAPDAVQKMMQVLGPEVGLVGQLTRYPDGKIYHAGKPRAPGGGIGFPHIDLGKHHPTITDPCEMENVNGASLLVRREAFYSVNGFDDGFLFYCEDDDLCMKMRLHGWQVWYTPLATGIHDCHQESAQHPTVKSTMHLSNQRFGHKWGEYFRHNRSNSGLGNFDYLKTSMRK